MYFQEINNSFSKTRCSNRAMKPFCPCFPPKGLLSLWQHEESLSQLLQITHQANFGDPKR